MASAPSSPTATRPAAKPLPGATWQANVVDASAITAELNRLWGRFGTEARDDRTEDPDAARGRRPFSVVTRASTLNLIAVGRSRDAARRVEDAVTQLSQVYPSRATILISDPDRPATETGLDVRVALLEQAAAKGRPAVLFECVIVEVAAASERHLASIVSPLLVADLPDFLWWAGQAVSGRQLLTDLIAVSDRLIVDSAAFTDPATDLRFLSSLVGRSQGCPKLSDFAWARSQPWRQLVTQVFDPPAARPALATIDEVDISYGGPGTVTGDGFTAALLFVGWLGSRLGWRSPGELVPVRNEPHTWRSTLRSETSKPEREVLLSLRPSDLPAASSGLARVKIGSDGGEAGTFLIDRVDPLGLATSSDLPGLPTVERLVYAEPPTDAALLADELRMFGRDQMFEEALAFAAALAPSTTDEAVDP